MGERRAYVDGIIDPENIHLKSDDNYKYERPKPKDVWDESEEQLSNNKREFEFENFDALNKPNVNSSCKNRSKGVGQPLELSLAPNGGPMIWSVSSSTADTPGDSGVQCLDSDMSDLTGDCPAGMTLSLVEAEELASDYTTEPKKNFDSVMTQSDIVNQNTVDSQKETMKSASDDIVFRRKCKKKSANQSQPKKRVSFHEDILNSTRTDNIHIEHGFISYRPEISMNYFSKKVGRYSWCAVGDTPYTESEVRYRSIKSDVLTYGCTDVNGHPDDSGVYEYSDKSSVNRGAPPCKCPKDENDSPDNRRQLYICSCSSSDSNLSSESETTSSSNSTDVKYSSKKCDKSYSCDCIENDNVMKPLVKTMYFSEANIGPERLPMSDIVPRSFPIKSALKKKRYITTDVIEENDNKVAIRTLLDSKNLFGSLKNIYKNMNFGLSIAERGVPEGSEDCQSVSEVLDEKRVNGDGDSSKKPDVVLPQKQNLSLDMSSNNGKTFLNWRRREDAETKQRNKCIVNCESTVYEHKGVSYCYEYDTFQTTFDTTKDTFTPIDTTTTKNQLDDERAESEDGTSTTGTPKLKMNEAMKNVVSKHLSSPLKQRNITRYEKAKQNELNFDTSSLQDADADSETLEIESNRKTLLMNRFLRNVSQKKAFYARLRHNEFFQRKIKNEGVAFPNILLPSRSQLTAACKLSAKHMGVMIDKEVTENKRVSVKLMTADEPSYFDSFEENVAIECCEKLRLELFRNPSEVLQRMLKVRSLYSQENGEWFPRLVFVTNYALYVADVDDTKSSYNLLSYLTHDQLDCIVIGPDSQYVQVFDKFGECQCNIITADRYLCHRLVSSLEWSSRNSHRIVNNAVIHGNIPSVIWKSRECLRKSLLKTVSYDRYERCLFYGMVATSAPSSFQSSRPASPFGQPMEGFLMYKTEKQRHWKPSYFLLKSGMLSYGSSTPLTHSLASCLPHSIDLKTAIGVRRCTDIYGRPYCFEIALNTGTSLLQMAAPDDDMASQWLQALLMHAAQALEIPKLDPSKKQLPPCCTLMVTSQHIITLREDLDKWDKKNDDTENVVDNNADGDTSQPIIKNDIEILSFASIVDLTALKIPDNDDNWCIMEFVFCEVHEGTEMGFLFTSSAELERFISIVESVWHTTNDGVFPICIQPSSRCSEWHTRLGRAWDSLLPQH